MMLTGCSSRDGERTASAGQNIVKGNVVQDDSYAFMAGLGGGLGEYECGAALIDPQWVLTAFHCVSPYVERGDTSGLVVGIGSNDSTRFRQLKVVQVVPHPSATVDASGRPRNDVAVLRLEAAVEGIAPVSLVESADAESSLLQANPLLIAPGWGRRSTDGSSDENRALLRSATMPFVDVSTCEQSLRSTYADDVVSAGWVPLDAATEMCAGGTDSSTCEGDSGGPLLAVGGSKITVVGVTSFGAECGTKGTAGIFARLATLGAWVDGCVRSGGTDCTASAASQ
jgi:secreted trypsin-like serine protease